MRYVTTAATFSSAATAVPRSSTSTATCPRSTSSQSAHLSSPQLVLLYNSRAMLSSFQGPVVLQPVHSGQAVASAQRGSALRDQSHHAHRIAQATSVVRSVARPHVARTQGANVAIKALLKYMIMFTKPFVLFRCASGSCWSCILVASLRRFNSRSARM